MATGAPDTRDNYYELFDVYWPVGVAVFLVVVVVVVVVVLRYRSSSDEFPPDREVGERKNMPLEGGYAFLLACVVAVLVYFTFDSMAELESSEPSATSPSIDVTAARWSWRFTYEDGPSLHGDTESPTTLVVPSETPVQISLTSRDVVHSFWIPHTRFKRDAFPGRTTSFVLEFDHSDEGFHRAWGTCAEFCGAGHADMVFNVDVKPADEFDQWLASQGGEA